MKSNFTFPPFRSFLLSSALLLLFLIACNGPIERGLSRQRPLPTAFERPASPLVPIASPSVLATAQPEPSAVTPSVLPGSVTPPANTRVATNATTIAQSTAHTKPATPTGTPSEPVDSVMTTSPFIISLSPSTSSLPGSGLGRLVFKGLADCPELKYEIRDLDGNSLGYRSTNDEVVMGTGRYDIGLGEWHDYGFLGGGSRFDWIDTVKDVEIMEGQDTTVELAFGGVTVQPNSNFDKGLYYRLHQRPEYNKERPGARWFPDSRSGATVCAPPGDYDLKPEAVGNLVIQVKIEPGILQDLSDALWSQLGLISFGSQDNGVQFKIFDSRTKELVGQGQPGWIKTGSYTLTVTSPYPGVKKSVEIRSGEKVDVQIP